MGTSLALNSLDSKKRPTAEKQMPGILSPLRDTCLALWVGPSWSVQALGLPQTPVAEAFQDAVNWFSAHV